MNSYIYPTATYRSSEWYKIARHLLEFLNRDFRSIHSEIMPEIFPRSHERRARMQRDIPFVHGIAVELARHYQRPPVRTLDGDGRSVAVIERVYRSLGINSILKSLSRKLVATRTVVGVWLPVPGRNRWTIGLFCPSEVEVDGGAVATDIDSVKEFRFRVPISSTHASINYGILRMTKDRAVYEGGGGSNGGVYTEDGSMPFDGYPVFVARLGDPAQQGDFFASLPTDLWSANVALCVAQTDIGFVSMYQSHGQRVVKGLTKERAQAMEWGADSVLGIDDTQDVSIVQAQSNVAPYIEATKDFVDLLRASYGLRPMDSSSAVTALAKRMELFDRDQQQEDLNESLREAEQSLARSAAIALSWNFGAATGTIEEPRVSMQYHPARIPADPLHEAQSNRMAFEDGLQSPSRVIAEAMGISVERAKEILEENSSEYAAMKESSRGKADAKIFKYHIDSGVVSANEVREGIGLGPVSGGSALMESASDAEAEGAE